MYTLHETSRFFAHLACIYLALKNHNIKVHSPAEDPGQPAHHPAGQADEGRHPGQGEGRNKCCLFSFPQILKLCDEFVPTEPSEYFFDR